VLGIAIDGTTTKMTLVAANGEILAFATVPKRLTVDARDFVAELIRKGERVCEEASKRGAKVKGIAIAVAGLLDSKRDRIVYNPNLAPLVGFPLVEVLHDHFACPVVLDADSNSACLGELRFGAGRGSRRLLSLTIGTGIGVGVALDGQILRIANECLGDAGHVIVDPDGPTCTAGCRGCAEALVSASALEAR